MIWRSCFRLSQWLHKVAVFHYPLEIESGRFSLMFVAKKSSFRSWRRRRFTIIEVQVVNADLSSALL